MVIGYDQVWQDLVYVQLMGDFTEKAMYSKVFSIHDRINFRFALGFNKPLHYKLIKYKIEFFLKNAKYRW